MDDNGWKVTEMVNYRIQLTSSLGHLLNTYLRHSQHAEELHRVGYPERSLEGCYGFRIRSLEKNET